MKYKANIDIMPLDELLDPQGKAVGSALKKLGIDSLLKVRVGKHILLEIEAEHEDDAKLKVEKACKKMLANPVIEQFQYELEQTE